MSKSGAQQSALAEMRDRAAIQHRKTEGGSRESARNETVASPIDRLVFGWRQNRPTNRTPHQPRRAGRDVSRRWHLSHASGRHGTGSTRNNARTPLAHGRLRDGLRSVIRAICPSCLCGRGRALSRLFRFQSRCCLLPLIDVRASAIAKGARHAKARGGNQPTARSHGPDGGGAERGGDV